MKIQAKFALLLGIISFVPSSHAQERNQCERFLLKNQEKILIKMGIPKYLNSVDNLISVPAFKINNIEAKIEGFTSQEDFLNYLSTTEVANQFVFPGKGSVTQRTYQTGQEVLIAVEFSQVIPWIQFTFPLQDTKGCRCRTANGDNEILFGCQVTDIQGNLVQQQGKKPTR